MWVMYTLLQGIESKKRKEFEYTGDGFGLVTAL